LRDPYYECVSPCRRRSSANFSVEFVRVLRVGGRQRDSLVGEVNKAREKAVQAQLIVVDRIPFKRGQNKIITKPGRLRRYDEWDSNLTSDNLLAIRYRYLLPTRDDSV